MMTDRELMRQALEGIDWLRHHLTAHHGCLHMDAAASGIPAWLNKTEAALGERLAQPEQKLLTEKRIKELYSFWVVDCQDIVGFARAVERTSKEKNNGQ